MKLAVCMYRSVVGILLCLLQLRTDGSGIHATPTTGSVARKDDPVGVSNIVAQLRPVGTPPASSISSLSLPSQPMSSTLSSQSFDANPMPKHRHRHRKRRRLRPGGSRSSDTYDDSNDFQPPTSRQSGQSLSRHHHNNQDHGIQDIDLLFQRMMPHKRKAVAVRRLVNSTLPGGNGQSSKQREETHDRIFRRSSDTRTTNRFNNHSRGTQNTENPHRNSTYTTAQLLTSISSSPTSSASPLSSSSLAMLTKTLTSHSVPPPRGGSASMNITMSESSRVREADENTTTAPSSPSPTSSGAPTGTIIVITVSGALVAAVVVALCCLWLRQHCRFIFHAPTPSPSSPDASQASSPDAAVTSSATTRRRRNRNEDGGGAENSDSKIFDSEQRKGRHHPLSHGRDNNTKGLGGGNSSRRHLLSAAEFDPRHQHAIPSLATTNSNSTYPIPSIPLLDDHHKSHYQQSYYGTNNRRRDVRQRGSAPSTVQRNHSKAGYPSVPQTPDGGSAPLLTDSDLRRFNSHVPQWSRSGSEADDDNDDDDDNKNYSNNKLPPPAVGFENYPPHKKMTGVDRRKRHHHRGSSTGSPTDSSVITSRGDFIARTATKDSTQHHFVSLPHMCSNSSHPNAVSNLSMHNNQHASPNTSSPTPQHISQGTYLPVHASTSSSRRSPHREQRRNPHRVSNPEPGGSHQQSPPSYPSGELSRRIPTPPSRPLVPTIARMKRFERLREQQQQQEEERLQRTARNNPNTAVQRQETVDNVHSGDRDDDGDVNKKKHTIAHGANNNNSNNDNNGNNDNDNNGPSNHTLDANQTAVPPPSAANTASTVSGPTDKGILAWLAETELNTNRDPTESRESF